MRAVIQRVKFARLEVNDVLVSQIGAGYVVYVGVMKDDTIENVKKMARRIASLRLFSDENDKLNYNISQVGGEILLVSNFTLCDKKNVSGTRPDFSLSAGKDLALDFYVNLQNELIDEYNIPVKMGKFAEDMQIYSHADGPINLVQEY